MVIEVSFGELGIQLQAWTSFNKLAELKFNHSVSLYSTLEVLGKPAAKRHLTNPLGLLCGPFPVSWSGDAAIWKAGAMDITYSN